MKVWIFRIGDGKNFHKSKKPFWVTGHGRYNCMLTNIKKLEKGDLLCFLKSKSYGGNFAGIATFEGYNDLNNKEHTVSFTTYNNNCQNWNGDSKNWTIQIYYKDLYITEKQKYVSVIKNASNMISYDKLATKKRDLPDLPTHYKYFKIYAEPKTFI
tara:strand:+ start:100 stop:567 length:468 start_codon:yes stop_codon:yes gene_type:complete